MNKLKAYILLFVLCCVDLALAQGQMGARLTAMGNNGSAVSDIWSLSANPSGITGNSTPVLAAHYANYFFDQELSRQAIAYTHPFGNNFIGLGFHRYGIVVYNEIEAKMGFAKQFGQQFSVGISVNYHQIQIKNYGTITGFSVNVGFMYKPFEELVFGFYTNNPADQKYNNSQLNHNISQSIHLGAAYHASNQVLIATTISKSRGTAATVGVGFDYKPFNLISLRGGINIKPFKQQVGIGINHKRLMLDMAVENDKQLGYLPQIAVAYAF